MKPLDVEWLPSSAVTMDVPTKAVVSKLLAADPRPHYQHDAQRIYAMEYGEWTIRFRVEAGTLIVVDGEHR